MLLSLGSTLLSIGRFALQITILFLFVRFVWFIVRTEFRRGFLRFPNPFQPGWPELSRQYGISQIVRPSEWMSGIIGATNYGNGLKVRFDTHYLVLQNVAHSGLVVQIPYADIETLQAPAAFQLSRLSEQEYTAGVFRAAGVKIELPAHWANQLIKHITAAGIVAPISL